MHNISAFVFKAWVYTFHMQKMIVVNAGLLSVLFCHAYCVNPKDHKSMAGSPKCNHLIVLVLKKNNSKPYNT